MDKETIDEEPYIKSVRRLAPGIKDLRNRTIKPGEVLIITFFAILVIVSVTLLINKIKNDRNLSNARFVSNEVIDDIQIRNGQAARALGSRDFQKNYSAKSLTSYFENIMVATLRPPKLVDTINTGDSSTHVVYFIYEYTALKVPYYIRTEVNNNAGKWQLLSLEGNANESQLSLELT